MRTVIHGAVCGCLLTSACLMAQAPAAFLDVTRVQVRGDKVKEFEDTIKKLAEVNRKYKGDHWLALTTEYGEFGNYTFSTPRENLSAVESGMDAMQTALKEGLGWIAASLLREISA